MLLFSTISVENYILYDKKNISVILQRLQSYLMEANASLSEQKTFKFQTMLTLLKEPISNDIISHFWGQKLSHDLKVYIPPFLIFIGLMGNIISFVIWRNKRMKRSSVNTYLSVLSLADISVLIFGLFSTWIHSVSGADIFRSVDVLCKLWNFFVYTSYMFSVWLVVIITTERFIVVCLPFLAHRICNQTKAHFIIKCLLLFSICFNLHFVITTGMVDRQGTTQCDALENHRNFVTRVWPWMDAIFCFFLPLFILVLLNTLIIINLVAATKRRRSLQHYLNNRTKGRHRGTCIKLNIMLLTTSIAFCISTCPMAILMISGVLLDSSLTPSNMANLLVGRTICELLMYVNHCINFILYCISGQKFTSILKGVILRRTKCHSKPSLRRKSHTFVTSRETPC